MPANEDHTPHAHVDQLDAHLERLAEHLQAGAPAEADLVALLPCEPAIGQVVVVCWQSEIPAEERTADTDPDEVDHAWEMVQLGTGDRIDDPKAFREALTLLAMAEALEELADPDTLDELVTALDAWCERAGDDAGRADIVAAVAKSTVRTIDLIRVIDGGTDEEGVAAGARIATPIELDRIGGMLRELDREFTATERAAERWAQSSWEDDRELVEALWATLSIARRGPLRTPVSAALEQGREAGTALADAVAGG